MIITYMIMMMIEFHLGSQYDSASFITDIIFFLTKHHEKERETLEEISHCSSFPGIPPHNQNPDQEKKQPEVRLVVCQ
jgi:hypothetical protein